jgi:hypothetical protein
VVPDDSFNGHASTIYTPLISLCSRGEHNVLLVAVTSILWCVSLCKSVHLEGFSTGPHASCVLGVTPIYVQRDEMCVKRILELKVRVPAITEPLRIVV